ncbi:hypothetical protein COU37_05155 [Candidatus Micrarchaeota archaeon CG10_big_fil_rev_8_21_14_0_10_45_29]|nr:MAG: hypothetical protein COU37_05155 [Candidatus Micrarchaeota archaeon CG10_big_fil_rev_8_21_14_0_10_45_29]
MSKKAQIPSDEEKYGPDSVQCPSCYGVFENLATLQEHLKEEECGNTIKICEFCKTPHANSQQDHLKYCLDAPTSAEELAVLDREITPTRRFGFDFDEKNRALHGIYLANAKGEPEAALVRADSKLIRESQFGDFGLKYSDYPPRTTLFEKYAWDRQSIKEFLRKKKGVQGEKQIFNDVKAYMKKYVHHSDERVYDFLACFIMATHIWIAFDAFPRLYLLAKPNSGKSQQIRAIRNLAFKPTSTGDATKAALYRLANAMSGLLLFDNFDKLPEEQKADVQHFIELSYQGDLPSFRAEDGAKGKKIPSIYETRAPVVVATTDFSAFTQAAFSRGFLLVMEQAPIDKKFSELPDVLPSEDSFELRNDLYAWGLTMVAKARKEAQELEMSLSNRNRQIAKPVIYIASLVGEEVRKSVAKWAEKGLEFNQIEEEFSEEGQIIRCLHELVKDAREAEVKVSVKEVGALWLSQLGVEQLIGEKPNPRYQGTLNSKCQRVSAKLLSIPTARKSSSRGITYYAFAKKILWRYFVRCGVLDESELQSTLQPSTPSSLPIPSSPSSPSTQKQIEGVESEDGEGQKEGGAPQKGGVNVA